MPLPLNAIPFDQPLDPSDVLDFTAELTRGADVRDFLGPGEGVTSFTLTVTPEAAAVGLQILADGDYAPHLVDNILTFWATTAPTQHSLPAFDGTGMALGVELTAITNSYPSRTKQRTLIIQVQQQ